MSVSVHKDLEERDGILALLKGRIQSVQCLSFVVEGGGALSSQSIAAAREQGGDKGAAVAWLEMATIVLTLPGLMGYGETHWPGHPENKCNLEQCNQCLGCGPLE